MKESEMSTRSLISFYENGTIFTAYCHFDGYLSGVGQALVENYDSLTAARKLVMGGDMRAVDARAEDIYRYRDGFGPRVYSGYDMPAALYNCGQEYEYFFRNGAWFYREEGTQDWYNVAEELGIQNKELS
jgi:hypothetical protein